ncbi:MAG TPA: DUF5317 domain-containing protein [Acidimicrobiia bacterium]|jgi:hypothetical protein|nr:DUF5317 domain-containing protein [Acidimicrobiia bacterium]
MLWLALVLFLAMTIAVLRGGRLSNLGDIQLRLWWLLPVAFLLQIATSWLPDSASWSEGVGLAMILTSFVLLLVLVILNRERTGMWLAGVGVLMNFSVITLNGGMPVLEGAWEVASGFADATMSLEGSYKHVVLDATTRLSFLADVIPIRLANQGNVVSLGDVFLAVGMGRFLESELRRPVRWFKRGARAQAGSASVKR